ncbi:MAG TPA: DUF3769 domain-containing protein [Leptolyngbyaceae cyanobacterium M65_K2018_010]|nr:DUF3769 domain-containing protein [Leptolyngbyaceae cyanobacterium M65_K2018_010]
MPLPLIVLPLPPAIEPPGITPEVSWPSAPLVAQQTPFPGRSPVPPPSGWVDKAVPTAGTDSGNSSPAVPLGAEPGPGERPSPGTVAGAAEADSAEEEILDEENLDEGAVLYSASALILRADRQEFEPQRQVIFATGDVLVQVGDSQLAADRLWVNLENRQVRAEGNVFFNRNQQILQAETVIYNLLQGAGTLTDARGAVQFRSLAEDFAASLPTTVPVASTSPIDYRLQGAGTISEVTSPGGVTLATDAQQFLFGAEQQDLRRLRFESSQISFDATGWDATEVRITNDPFSPPEIELRSNQVTLTPLPDDQDRICFDHPRLVFDQTLSIPVFRRCFTLQRGQLPDDAFNPLPTSIGYDALDRGGLFIEREVRVPMVGPWRFSIVPQFYISRWLDNAESFFDPENFGFVARLNGPIGPRTTATAVVSLPGLDLSQFTQRVRASFRTQQLIGTHRLNLEYTYRDRLFNGSLGFQDVQSSIGGLLESPVIPLGDSQINLTYQVSGQYVTANTDDASLLPTGETFGLTSLPRAQGSADLSRSFVLWRGQPKPSTTLEGLRYSPRPIVPSLGLSAGVRGTATYYGNNTLQSVLEARVSLAGQLGHLVRDFFDFTQFNLGFSTSLLGGEPSPFLFDRVVDQNTLSGGIIQQIYGPILVGFQTSWNIDERQVIETNFVIEYRRRAYGVLLRYNPQQETGFLGFRLSDFNWTGVPERFDGVATGAEQPMLLAPDVEREETWTP